MQTFRQYVEIHDGLGDTSQSEVNPEEALIRLAKMAAEDHRDEFMRFFEDLGKTDGRIKQELETYKKDSASGLHHRTLTNDDEEKDTVVPNGTDGYAGAEE